MLMLYRPQRNVKKLYCEKSQRSVLKGPPKQKLFAFTLVVPTFPDSFKLVERAFYVESAFRD